MAATDRLMTADELWRLPDDGMRHELVAGEMRTYPLNSGEHGWVAAKIAGPLGQHVDARRLGVVFSTGTGFRLTANPDTVRAPDIAFVRRERVLAAENVRGFWPGAPDLAVEVIEPHELYLDVVEKLSDWLDHGAQMVLAMDLHRHVVAVHRPDQPMRRLTEDDVLDGEDVVPGWTLPVREIFSHGLED